MPTFQIEFNPSMSQLAHKLEGLDMPGFLNRAIKELALRTERESKLETPIDRGGLRSSIRTSLSPLGASIRPHVPYAHWIHEGWMSRGGRKVYIRGFGRGGTPAGGKPFMKMGATSAIEGFEEKISHDLETEIRVKLKSV